MALLSYRSQFTDGRVNVPICEGSEVRAVRAVLSILANPTANDVAHVIDLPSDHVPILAGLDSTDMDTNVSPAMTVSLGVMNAAKNDLSSLWLSASTISQAGTASVTTSTAPIFQDTHPETSPMSVGVKFPNAAATFAAGTIGVTIMYRRADAANL